MNNECFALGRLMATRGVADKMNDCPEFERFARQAFARYPYKIRQPLRPEYGRYPYDGTKAQGRRG